MRCAAIQAFAVSKLQVALKPKAGATTPPAETPLYVVAADVPAWKTAVFVGLPVSLHGPFIENGDVELAPSNGDFCKTASSIFNEWSGPKPVAVT